MDQYFNLHVLKQYIIGDVAQEMIMFEPRFLCLFAKSWIQSVNIIS